MHFVTSDNVVCNAVVITETVNELDLRTPTPSRSVGCGTH